MSQCKDRLYETRDTGGCIQMTDIGFDRTDGTVRGISILMWKNLHEGGHLDRITHRGAGAMSFDVGN